MFLVDYTTYILIIGLKLLYENNTLIIAMLITMTENVTLSYLLGLVFIFKINLDSRKKK